MISKPKKQTNQKIKISKTTSEKLKRGEVKKKKGHPKTPKNWNTKNEQPKNYGRYVSR